MRKKIIITSILIISLAIGIFIYLQNKQLNDVMGSNSKYVFVQMKGSIYPGKIMVLKGSTLNEVIMELNKVDSNHYSHYFLNKKEISGSYKIFKDIIFTIK